MSEPSPETKLEILWRAHEAKEDATAKPAGGGLPRLPDNAILWLVLIASAFGMGPDVIKNLAAIMGVK